MKIEKTGECLGHNSAIYALAAAKKPNHFYSAGGDGFLVEWILDEPDLGKAVADVGEQIFSILLLPDSENVLLGTMNGGIFQVLPGQPDKTRNIRHHNNKGVFGLLAVGERIFSVGGDGVLTVWHTDELRPLESFKLSNRALRCISFSKNRNELAIGGSDGAIYFLDANDLTLKNTIPAAHGSSVFSLAYFPDEKKLASGGRDAMLRIWDLENDFEKLAEIPAHRYTLNDLKFSPDGKFLVTASRDRHLKIWDAQNLELLKVADAVRSGGHFNSVNKLLWLGEHLVSCSDDRTVKIWKISI